MNTRPSTVNTPTVTPLSASDGGEPPSGRLPAQVGRADQPLAVGHGGDDVDLFEHVVAEGDDVDAVAADLVEQVLGDAGPAGDVLGVGDDQIDLPLADQAGQFVVNGLAAGPADDVAKAKNFHRAQYNGQAFSNQHLQV